METLLMIAQLVGAALAGAGVLKGSEYAVNKYRKNSAGQEIIPQEVCSLKHSAIDSNIHEIKDDINELKETLNKLVDLQLEVVRVGNKIDLAKEEIKSELKEAIHEMIQRHEDKYHNAA